MPKTFSSSFTEASKLFAVLAADRKFQKQIALVIARLLKALQTGHKILLAGNGGSAAQCQHFAGELMGRFYRERDAYPALALTTDTSILTAVGNDYAFDQIFARQVEGLGQVGDVLAVFSTSGNSKNLVEAVAVARKRKLVTVGLLGCGGGALKNLVDRAIVVPSDSTPRIQEAHQLLLHTISEAIEGPL